MVTRSRIPLFSVANLLFFLRKFVMFWNESWIFKFPEKHCIIISIFFWKFVLLKDKLFLIYYPNPTTVYNNSYLHRFIPHLRCLSDFNQKSPDLAHKFLQFCRESPKLWGCFPISIKNFPITRRFGPSPQGENLYSFETPLLCQKNLYHRVNFLIFHFYSLELRSIHAE